MFRKTPILLLILLASCQEEKVPVIPVRPGTENGSQTETGKGDSGNEGKDDGNDSNPKSWREDFELGAEKHGLTYLYEDGTLPELHVNVPLNEWNRLLEAFDCDRNTTEQVHCNLRYVKKGEVTDIADVGIRLKGNTSRRRPEGNAGEEHKSSGTDWHHVHFQLNFHKYVKDDQHKIHGAKKVTLKWFKDDPMYVRELYCYDFFQRKDVWTAAKANYCRLFIKIEGDLKETYYGVYCMIEPVDEDFLKVRKAASMFGESGGNLWKCRYGANLNDANSDMGADLDDGNEHTYELKTNTDQLLSAKAQLKDFISNSSSLTGDSFVKWMSSHCDVDLLLRTYAINVAVGMWDDYWNNTNNYYIYFNSTDVRNYCFYMIPYDYDNTLGTTGNCGVQSNAGKHDPYNWGDNNRNPLIYRILKVEQWRQLYTTYLLDAVSEKDGVSWKEASMERISSWQSLIRPFVKNDTGEDCSIYDMPAYWSSRSYYRLLEDENNWFTIKDESIRSYCTL